ncbi:hypothetical protein [Streptomyces sp. NPDC047525]|uniref:hypothetical protein n=1 Tax=Streptomyces sp. NPDC047525 TaxID=3155264 RepID=UPI003406C3EE
MAKELNPDNARSVAQELLNGRLDAVDRHAANLQREQERRDALTAAQKETAQSWADLRALWSVDELRRMGFKEPAVKAPGRPRTRTAPTGKATPPPQRSEEPSLSPSGPQTEATEQTSGV